MPQQLSVTIGQYSDKGSKPTNQDFHGALVPDATQLHGKGIAVAIADGISSSGVSQIASSTAVRTFLDDYYCTSEAWSVNRSATRVIQAINSWLHSQTRQSEHRYDRDRGYVCTFSAAIFKSTTAHLFHVGDARICRLRDGQLEQLTEDHRFWVAQETSYLARALGMDSHLEVDYRALPLTAGDLYLLMTDGVYEYIGADDVHTALAAQPDDLDTAAYDLINLAMERGSADNLTLQLVRVDELPDQTASEIYQSLTDKAFPPVLEEGMAFDGYRILRTLHSSSRSHVFLARDEGSGAQVVLKVPSIDLRADPAYLEAFFTEEWIARKIDNPHVLKAPRLARPRGYLYTVMEYVEGQTLAQWMNDNPQPDLESVRSIVEQIAKGLRALHRQEMLHQDLRPENVLIDRSRTVKLIDFGSTRVAGVDEDLSGSERGPVPGTVQYAAPEYFLGEGGSPASDLFSLAVVTYQMLSGRLPYGLEVARCRSRAAQNRLRYRSVLDEHRQIPAWVDETLRKALQVQPHRRYQALSEFVYDLRHPNQAYLRKTRPPLIERNPLLFWKGVALLLALGNLVLLLRLPH